MPRLIDRLAQSRLKSAMLRISPYRRAISRAYESERALMFASLEEVRREQERRLRELLTLALRAPYWREVLASRRIQPATFTLDRLCELPFLTKDILRRHEQELRIPGASGVYENFSGGSTGIPIRFYQDDRYKVHMSVSTRLCNEMAGAFPGARLAKLWGAPQDKRQIESPAGRLKLWLLNHRYLDTFDMGPRRMDAYHAEMEEFQPDLIQAYASSIHLLARHLKRRRIRPSYPRLGIISSAERLTEAMRREIEEVFPVKVFNRYGSREVSAMAAECEHHNGLHITSAGHIVETVDPVTLEPVRGGPGEIVITVLHNHAMPFLRYRIGDVGRLEDAPCPCGRTTPRLVELLGRTSDNFLMPDGRIVHGEYFTHMFYGRPEVKQFQFVQDAVDEFVLRIVPGKGYSGELGRRFEEELRVLIGSQARLRLEIREEIPKTASGKYRFTISKVKVDELAGVP
ncbi:MAG: phenylacetate--CoA ligase family protein [Acidobacteria bacterium]|nr:phenylacetate--CoA ligase family protein [Acidobacteriota bacterium]